MNEHEREMDLALAEAEQENRLLRARNERLEDELFVANKALTDRAHVLNNYEGLIRDLTDAMRAQAMPPPPMECKTEEEKTAYSFGWFKALEQKSEWIGLTPDDLPLPLYEYSPDFQVGMQWAENKLKEKNNG